jgi:hypothetical protein
MLALASLSIAVVRCATPILPIAIGRPRSSPPQSLPKQTFNAPRQQTASLEIPIAPDARPRHTFRGFLHWRFADAGPTVAAAPPSWGRHPQTFTTADIARYGRQVLKVPSGRSSRMTSATPVASISRYRRNAIIRYGNRAAIFSELTEPRKPDLRGGATRHAPQGSNEGQLEVRYVSSNGSTRQFAYQASPDGASRTH